MTYNEHLTGRRFRFAPIGGGTAYRRNAGAIVEVVAGYTVRDIVTVSFGEEERPVAIRDLLSI